MKVIVGLGNPTKKYENTFHNVGFLIIRELQKELQPVKEKTQFHALTFQGKYQEINYLLLLPQTYMNLSGKAIVACLNFYKIPKTELLVVYDNLDLPLAKVRYKTKGGHGGHRGLQDIIQKLSSTEFARLSIGIGRPVHKEQVSQYVLQNIPAAFQKTLQVSVKTAMQICIKFLMSQNPQAVNQ